MTLSTVRANHLRGYGMIALSALMFGSYGVWSKLIGEAGFGIFYQGWVRAGIITIVIFAILACCGRLQKIQREDYRWLAIPVAFGVFTQAPLYYAFNTVSLGVAILVFYSSYIIASYAIGVVMLSERLTPVKIVAGLLGLCGLAMVAGDGQAIGGFSVLGIALAAINGIASGGEVASTKKTSDKYSSWTISLYMWAGILLTHLPLSLMMGEAQMVPTWSVGWGVMAVFAALGMLSLWLVVEGYKHVDASIGGLIGVSEVVWGVLFGIVLFQERLTWVMGVGGVLIVVAGMLPDIMGLLSQKRSNRGGTRDRRGRIEQLP